MFESRLTAMMAVLTLIAAAAVALFDDSPAPALTLIGALVLAIVAAETADARQQRQIAADAERQARELSAEHERHLATLNHGRELADLADLRGLLDEASLALHRAHGAASNLCTAYERQGPTFEDRLLAAAAEQAGALDALEPRLDVRLGQAAPVAAAFTRATSAAVDVVQRVKYDPDPAAAREAAGRLVDEWAKFNVASVDLAGTRLSSLPAVPEAAVVVAVEAALRRAFAHSAPGTDEEWRRDAETVAEAALAVLSAGPPRGARS